LAYGTLVSPSEILPHPDLGDPIWRGMVCVETGNVGPPHQRVVDFRPVADFGPQADFELLGQPAEL